MTWHVLKIIFVVPVNVWEACALTWQQTSNLVRPPLCTQHEHTWNGQMDEWVPVLQTVYRPTYTATKKCFKIYPSTFNGFHMHIIIYTDFELTSPSVLMKIFASDVDKQYDRQTVLRDGISSCWSSEVEIHMVSYSKLSCLWFPCSFLSCSLRANVMETHGTPMSRTKRRI